MDADDNIPESLKIALKKGNVVPFIGAGVSRAIEKKEKDETKPFNPLFPIWWEFLNNAADKLIKENKLPKATIVRGLINDEPPDYLEAAQRAFDGIGNKQWYELLSENFEIDIESADENSLKLAKLIWQLGSNLVLTTNIDLVLQSVHEKLHQVKILDTQSPEFAEIQKDWRPSRPTVLHLHGHIDNKANIVFTKTQYDNFYNKEKNSAKLETLRSLFTQRTIVFIGFSLDDLFILKELERVNLIYEGGANSFYVLIREAEKDNPNIPKYVEKITFPNFGKPLEDLVAELSSIAETKDVKIKGEPTKIIKTDEKKPFFNVPYNSKAAEFVGRLGKREEIWNLLSQDGCASIGQAVSVKGFGGLGKTQLAVEFAHTYRNQYKNGVFWLVGDENIDNQLLQIADRQGWINQFDKTVNQLDVAKAKFLTVSDCLILFDNVEKYEDIKDYLPKTNRQTHLLITSREKQAVFRQIDLELLERDESRDLLLKVAKRELPVEDEKENLEKVLETLGDIPLAVELVGGYLAEHENVTFAKYHQFLNEIPLDQLEKEFPEGSFTNHDRSIIQTLRISEKTIKEKPLMVEILKVLAWSGSSSMGISLLQDLVEAENDFAFETALGDAYKLRLLKKDEDAERYAIHRLLAKVIQHEKPLEKQKKWHKKIVDKLEDWFNVRKNRFENLDAFELEIEHLEIWQEKTFEILSTKSIVLLQLRGNIPRQRGLYHEAFKFFEQALELYEKEKLLDNKLLADLQNDLGSCYGELGNSREALKYLLPALEISCELFGEEHLATTTILNNLGSTYTDLGNYKEALKYNLQALKIRKESFGNNHVDIAISLNNIGLVYSGLGNHKEALKYQLQCLEIQKELFGEKHPSTALYLNNVGLSYGYLENYEEALKYHLQSLKIQKELFGEKNPNTALYLNNVGGAYKDLGNINEALKHTFQALEIRKELFIENHPDTANSLHNLGWIFSDLGNYREALKYQIQALEIHQELLGKQHPNSIFIARNLIITYLKLGNRDKAGRKAGEYFNDVPQNHPDWKFFDEVSRPYRSRKKRHKKK